MNSPRSHQLDKRYSGIQLQIQIDNICNAACIMCGSHNSTTWQKYERNISGKPHSLIEDEKKLVDIRIQNILNLFTDKEISLIKFVGGEPFESDTHIKFLKEIKKIVNTKEISLIYTTNASKLPDNEILDIWKEFLDVKIDISVDGIEEHFNYIRWPLQWHQVEENIKFYRDLKSIKLHSLAITLNPFNIYYYDRYVDWSVKTLGVNKFHEPIECLGVINLSCVPDKLKDIIHLKYENTESLFKLVDNKSIPKLLSSFDPIKYKEFIKYIEFHDRHRKLNWREVFPEVEQYFHHVD
jgi:sulfatase maturation enzyme AslB (radical SAM superfamily)